MQVGEGSPCLQWIESNASSAETLSVYTNASFCLVGASVLSPSAYWTMQEFYGHDSVWPGNFKSYYHACKKLAFSNFATLVVF